MIRRKYILAMTIVALITVCAFLVYAWETDDLGLAFLALELAACLAWLPQVFAILLVYLVYKFSGWWLDRL
jgi:hypothetical protein